jgi:hypothetical protein
VSHTTDAAEVLWQALVVQLPKVFVVTSRVPGVPL